MARGRQSPGTRTTGGGRLAGSGAGGSGNALSALALVLEDARGCPGRPLRPARRSSRSRGACPAQGGPLPRKGSPPGARARGRAGGWLPAPSARPARQAGQRRARPGRSGGGGTEGVGRAPAPGGGGGDPSGTLGAKKGPPASPGSPPQARAPAVPRLCPAPSRGWRDGRRLAERVGWGLLRRPPPRRALPLPPPLEGRERRVPRATSGRARRPSPGPALLTRAGRVPRAPFPTGLWKRSLCRLRGLSPRSGGGGGLLAPWPEWPPLTSVPWASCVETPTVVIREGAPAPCPAPCPSAQLGFRTLPSAAPESDRPEEVAVFLRTRKQMVTNGFPQQIGQRQGPMHGSPPPCIEPACEHLHNMPCGPGAEKHGDRCWHWRWRSLSQSSARHSGRQVAVSARNQSKLRWENPKRSPWNEPQFSTCKMGVQPGQVTRGASLGSSAMLECLRA